VVSPEKNPTKYPPQNGENKFSHLENIAKEVIQENPNAFHVEPGEQEEQLPEIMEEADQGKS